MRHSKINGWFHGIILSIIIVHIAVCSKIFDGTHIWSYLTILVEAFFIIVSLQYFNKVKELNALEQIRI
jgi:uncharacterized protein (DUF983 family)